MCVITQEFICRLVHPKTPSYSYTDFKERTDTLLLKFFCYNTVQSHKEKACSWPSSPSKRILGVQGVLSS